MQEAAVVGKVFWAEPLQLFLGGEVSAPLLALERRGLINARTTSSLANHAEYSFKHVLVRDVAYASLPKARRAKAHAEVGDWLEALSGDRTEEFGELLAYHYRTAVAVADADLAWSAEEREPVRLKALAHLIRAGAQARKRYAVAKAVELHEQAIDIAVGDTERMRALEELGDDHESAYHGDVARSAYMEALEIARRNTSSLDRARICAKLAEMMSYSPGAFTSSPDPEPVEQLVAEGLACSSNEETRAHLQIAFGSVARLYRGSEPFGQGSAPDTVPLHERIAAVEAARAVGESRHDAQLMWLASASLGILYGMAGRYQEHLALAMRELPQVERLGSRIQQGDAVRRAAVVTMNIGGNYEAGLNLALRSLELSRDTNPHHVMHGTFPIMAALFELDRWDEISDFLEEHLNAFRLDPAVECDFVRDGPIIGAVVAAKSGDADRARELAGLVGDPADDIDRATAWQARLAVAMSRPDTARRISSGKALEGRSYGPHHARSMLEALIAMEDWVELDMFTPLARRHAPGLAVLAPCCDRAEGLLARSRGNRGTAAAAFERAISGFEALNARAELAATRKLLTPPA